MPAVVALVLAACSPGPAEPTTPTPTAPMSPQITDPRFGAPVVVRPREIGPSAEKPCALLSPAQLTGLGFRPTTASPRESLVGSAACRWKDDSGDLALDVAAFAHEDMLVRSYENRIFAIFRPTTVAGSPAVEQKTADDVNICTVTAGVRDGQAIEATWFGGPARPGATEACRGATEVVAAALGNLPPAS